MDVVWRRKAARLAAHQGGLLWLDVCSGTGEMARSLDRQARGRPKIVVADFSPAMIQEFRSSQRRPRFLFTLAEAGHLPFPSGIFDLITIAFATRNIQTSDEALLLRLKEFYRILRPGGLLVNLETSQPPNSLVRKLFHTYVRLVVRPVGFFLSGSREGYAYLSSTIPCFHSAKDFSRLLREVGFSPVEEKLLSFGVAAIHLAFK